MTREEQIIEIGAQFAIDETDGQTSGRAASMRGVLLSAFRAGAHWADQHPHWISVEEELPKERGKLYLVCDKYGRVCESAYDVEDDIWYRQSGTVLSPTHWMPMPVPPRKEE